jgi:cell division protein FtsZ
MVIDENMEDEIRVTVIATGIGKVGQKKTVEPSTVRPLRRLRPEGVIDYDLLQVPPSVRQRLPLGEAAQGMEQVEPEPDSQQPSPKRRTLLQMITGGGRSHEEEDLSIPTFIRRQAD